MAPKIINNSEQSNIKFKELISSIPNEIWVNIFLFLPHEKINPLSLVCKKWEGITNSDFVQITSLTNHYGPIVLYYFASLVKGKVISWKEVPHYYPLASFPSRIADHRFCCKDFIKLDNPEINQYKFDNPNNPHLLFEPTMYLPKNSVSYGKYNFSIHHLYNVEIINKETGESVILEGDPTKRLTHIGVEENLLFCLTITGEIIQYDIEKKEKIKEIQSEYSKGNTKLEKLKKIINNHNGYMKYPIAGKKAFFVKDGYIVIKYIYAKWVEIIPYSNPDKSILIQNKHFSERFPNDLCIKQKKLYVIGEEKIVTYDITNKTISTLNAISETSARRTLNVQKNIICSTMIFDASHTYFISIINKKTKKVKHFDSPTLEDIKVSVITNLAWGVTFNYDRLNSLYDTSATIFVMPLDDEKKTSKRIITVKFDTFNRTLYSPSNFKKIDKTEILKKLIKTQKTHEKKYKKNQNNN